MLVNKVSFCFLQCRIGLMVDTLIVWTEPQTNLDIALSFQDPDGCEDIWSFVCDVQRHLNNLPSKLYWSLDNVMLIKGDADHLSVSSEKFSLSPVVGPGATEHARTHWVPLTLANIKSVTYYPARCDADQKGPTDLSPDAS